MFPLDTKILLVEDATVTRTVLLHMLHKLGYTNVTEAENGLVARAKLDTADTFGVPFQLILSDWNMPELTGIELLRKIRSEPAHCLIPFIMLTNNAQRRQVSEAIAEGVTTYLAKPVTIEALQEKLLLAWKANPATAARGAWNP